MGLVLDGEAEPSQKSGLEDHLKQCQDCRQQFEFYSQLRQMTRQACSRESCPELVQSRLLRALGAEVQAPPPRQARPIRGLGWLAAASAAFVSFYALRPAAEKATPLALSLSQDHSRCCVTRPNPQPSDPGSLAEQAFGNAMPEFAQVQQLQPYDVRVCRVMQGEPVIHVLCRDHQDRVVSLYSMPCQRCGSVQGTETAPSLYETEDARVAAWEHKGWMFSLVSRVPQEDLCNLACQCTYESPQVLASRPYAQPLDQQPMGGVPVVPVSAHP